MEVASLATFHLNSLPRTMADTSGSSPEEKASVKAWLRRTC